jgi:drug/metabolite transporter (DMT)-like permease
MNGEAKMGIVFAMIGAACVLLGGQALWQQFPNRLPLECMLGGAVLLAGGIAAVKKYRRPPGLRRG